MKNGDTRLFRRVYYTDECTNGTHLDVGPTELRLDKTFIIAYVNWIWCVSTGIMPFIALLLLNCKIFLGLKKVQKNLNRHQRLAKREEELEAAEGAKGGARNANGVVNTRAEITNAGEVTVNVEEAKGITYFEYKSVIIVFSFGYSVRTLL